MFKIAGHWTATRVPENNVVRSLNTTFPAKEQTALSRCAVHSRILLIGIRCLAASGLCMFLVRIHGTEAQYVQPSDPVTAAETQENGERCPR